MRVSPLFSSFVKALFPVYNRSMRFLTVSEDDENRRIDRVLRKAFPHIPPGALAGAVRKGRVRINGGRCKNESRVHAGDVLKVPLWESKPGEEHTRSARYQGGRVIAGSWRIEVLDRSRDWLVLNKPAGLATHGRESLDEIVRGVAKEEGWWAESLSFRPGPVHRLDRNTSGVQLFALSAEGARSLSEQFSRREVWKLYLAVLEGVLQKEREATHPLRYDNRLRRAESTVVSACAGHEPSTNASSRIVPLAHTESGREATLVAAIPTTGRTHQIRSHCAAIGHPLESDRKYGGGGEGRGGRHFLHALFLGLSCPPVLWEAPIPPAALSHLEARFPRFSSVSDHLREVARATCTTIHGTDTIGR